MDTVEQAQIVEEQQRARALSAHRMTYQGQSARQCIECAEPLPQARRKALPGIQTCVTCQTLREKRL